MSGSGGGGMIIDLQTIFSIFRDDPRLYNPVTYLICGPLLIVWIFVTLRAKPTRSKDYFALAAIAALSMLPVYHRPYDAKLLLLTLPACAMVLAEGGPLGRIGLVLNSLADPDYLRSSSRTACDPHQGFAPFRWQPPVQGDDGFLHSSNSHRSSGTGVLLFMAV